MQHYVELLRPLPIWGRERIRVVDAGCGKAYMSLALVALRRARSGTRRRAGRPRSSTRTVIETVRGVASSLGYDEAQFEVSTIADYAGDEPIDLLVSLHACDTATDEAIAAGVRLGAEAIVLATATVQFTAAAAYPACQEAVRHLSNSRDWLIFFQIFLYKPV